MGEVLWVIYVRAKPFKETLIAYSILTLVPALIIRQEKPVHFKKPFQVCRPVDRDIKSTSHTRRDMGMSQNEVLFFC